MSAELAVSLSPAHSLLRLLASKRSTKGCDTPLTARSTSRWRGGSHFDAVVETTTSDVRSDKRGRMSTLASAVPLVDRFRPSTAAPPFWGQTASNLGGIIFAVHASHLILPRSSTL